MRTGLITLWDPRFHCNGFPTLPWASYLFFWDTNQGNSHQPMMISKLWTKNQPDDDDGNALWGRQVLRDEWDLDLNAQLWRGSEGITSSTSSYPQDWTRIPHSNTRNVLQDGTVHPNSGNPQGLKGVKEEVQKRQLALLVHSFTHLPS